MGYLDKATITVDAILTNRGRELLAKGGVGAGINSFNITKFAVADDEIDYGLYRVDAVDVLPGYIIENMPILEATPDEQQIMRYKLTTLSIPASGQVIIPTLNVSAINNTITNSTGPITVTVSTTPTPNNDGKYVFQISNARLFRIETGNAAAGVFSELTPSLINANGSATAVIERNPNTSLASIRFTLIENKVYTTGDEITVTVFGETTGATNTFKVKYSAS